MIREFNGIKGYDFSLEVLITEHDYKKSALYHIDANGNRTKIKNHKAIRSGKKTANLLLERINLDI